MNYGTKRGDFLGQENLKPSHNNINYGTKQDDFLGQENSILDHIETRMRCCFGTGEVDF